MYHDLQSDRHRLGEFTYPIVIAPAGMRRIIQISSRYSYLSLGSLTSISMIRNHAKQRLALRHVGYIARREKRPPRCRQDSCWVGYLSNNF